MLNRLRDQDAEIAAGTSKHVGQWSIEAILADSEGYGAASVVMRASMRARIASEKTILYPLLERAEPN
jgi:hypothetical protein